MLGEEIKTTAIKTIVELAVKLFFGLVIAGVAAVIAYFISIGKNLFQDPAYAKVFFALLCGSVIALYLMLILTVRMYWRHERFQEAFGVFWDKNYKMRCLSCRKPLKHSSFAPSILFCSDPKCNSKHILKDAGGNEMTPQDAIANLKQSPKPGSSRKPYEK